MRNWIYIVLLFQSFTIAAQQDSLFSNAVLLLQKDQFKEANILLEKLASRENDNLSVYYNLGLSYFELKDFGNAIWAFEKCLRMDPKNEDIENALTLCYLKLDPEGVLEIQPTMIPALARISPFTWSLIGIVSSVIISFLLIMLFMGKWAHFKGFILFSVILFGGILIFSIYGGMSSSEFRNQKSKAVVTHEALIYLKDFTPSNDRLPLGTVVTISDTLENEFVSCKTGDRNAFIIEASSLRSL